MSRICVKGLPKYAAEDKVRGFFSALGDITDVKVARTKEGKSRQFAFVGFKSPESATAAIRKFNNAFMDTARLRVEEAQPIGADSVLQRAWSKHAKDKAVPAARTAPAEGATASSVAKPSKGGVDPVEALAGDVKDKERLAEFLSLMKAPSATSTWANDDGMGSKAAAALKSGSGRRGRAAADEEAAAIAAAAAAAAKADSSDDDSDDDDVFDPDAPGSTAAKPSTKPSAKPTGAKAAKAGPAGAAGAGGLSDLDFLRSKMVKEFSDSDSDSGSDSESHSDEDGGSDAGSASGDDDDDDDAVGKEKARGKAAGKGKAKAKEDAAPAAAPAAASTAAADPVVDVGETGRLFIRNLPFSASEAEVRSHFGAWGRLADVRLPVDPTSGRHRGFAIVTFVVPEQALAALAEADGHVFQGRILHVLPAQPERPAPGAGGGDGDGEGGGDGSGEGSKVSKGTGGAAAGGSSFKAQREAARKAAAGGVFEAGAVWNSLFIRPDTTLAAVAEALGVSKGGLLLDGDRDGSGDAEASAGGAGGKSKSAGAASMAVRAALAEAAVIAETKTFLKDEGVSLPSLQAALEASAAAAAAADARKAAAIAGGKGAAAVAAAAAAAAAAAVPEVTRSDRVLLVKNLPFTASQEALRDLFGRHGALARLVLPPSRAIAVVEFADARAAKRAFSGLAYTRFQRVPLYLEWAPVGVFGDAPAPAPAPPVPAAPADAKSKDGKKDGKKGKASASEPAEPFVIDKKGDSGLSLADKTAASEALTGSKRKREGETAAGPGDAAAKRSRGDEDTAAAASAAAASAAAASASGEPSTAAVSASSSTLYVKNLSFTTGEASLRALFAPIGPLRAVRIPMRRDTKAPSASATAAAAAAGAKAKAAPAPGWLSMGYGFVEYVERKDAETALRRLQGADLDGHSLQLKLSTAAAAAMPSADEVAGAKAAAAKVAAAKSAAAGAADSGATKLLIRNLAFEATRKEVASLLAPFGTLRSLRLPRKFDGSNRGFAFADFASHADAVAAMEALSAAHLYGRHFVIEWAAKDADKGGPEGEDEGGDAAATTDAAGGAGKASKDTGRGSSKMVA